MITAISPLDGRYKDKVEALCTYFSEFALMRYRIIVEISYLMALSSQNQIQELPLFTDGELKKLENIINKFDTLEAKKIKNIEKKTNHDVKAVEYYIRENLTGSLSTISSFVHFGLTSEDVNNLAYALSIKQALKEVYFPALKNLYKETEFLAKKWKGIPMLSLTHGQEASPTTLGKEFFVFAKRLERQIKTLENIKILGKLNGATGNYNALVAAYPKINWEKLSKKFVQELGLIWNPITTQIDSHDNLAEVCDNLRRINTIVLDMDKDIWIYISRRILSQKMINGEIGSSTMPHKVNPIDFENSEGNLGVANALFSHFSEKLPISRMQRDLSDSTVFRNLGVAFGHSILAYKSTIKGLKNLDINKHQIRKELDNSWAVLSEAIQTIMRKHGDPNAYEKLKNLSRGKEIGREDIKKFIEGLKISKEDKERLLKLTPQEYIGIARRLVR